MFCRIEVTELSAFSSVDSDSAARWRLVAYCEISDSDWLTPSERAAATGSSPAVRNLEFVDNCCCTLKSRCCCWPMAMTFCS